MQFKAHCQCQSKDIIVAKGIYPDEVYIICSNGVTHKASVVLSKEDALALASTIINHYKVDQRGS